MKCGIPKRYQRLEILYDFTYHRNLDKLKRKGAVQGLQGECLGQAQSQHCKTQSLLQPVVMAPWCLAHSVLLYCALQNGHNDPLHINSITPSESREDHRVILKRRKETEMDCVLTCSLVRPSRSRMWVVTIRSISSRRRGYCWS